MEAEYSCPIEITLSYISGKWKVLIMKELIIEQLRFGELKRRLPNVSAKVLTQQLKELEADGILIRTVYAEVPARVEYSLSDMGVSMLKILKEMAKWGLENNAEIRSKCPQCRQCFLIDERIECLEQKANNASD